MLYVIEQCLNGIQLGMLLFLLAAGLTLIFGIMDLVNLAHGSLYMLGAYFAATFAALTDSFLAGIGLALLATLVAGMALEVIAIRPLYGRDHLDQVLGTFGLLLFFNELVRLIWGPAGLTLSLPPEMLSAVEVLPGVYYPIYRLVIILATLAVALLLYVLVMRTRIGMLIRAGASNREMVGALGVNIKPMWTSNRNCKRARNSRRLIGIHYHYLRGLGDVYIECLGLRVEYCPTCPALHGNAGYHTRTREPESAHLPRRSCFGRVYRSSDRSGSRAGRHAGTTRSHVFRDSGIR